MFTRNDSEIEVTDEEFKQVLNSSKKIVVNFFAEWCMPCLMMSPILEDLANKMNDIKFVKINIDDHSEFASKFNVNNIPCILILKDGIELHRLTGSITGEVIEEKVKNHLND